METNTLLMLARLFTRPANLLGLIEGIGAPRRTGRPPVAPVPNAVSGRDRTNASHRCPGPGRSAGGGEAWGPVGEAEVAEDALDDLGLGEEGEDAQGAVASGAAQGIELVDAR